MALLEFRSKAAGGFFMMPQTFKEVCHVLECSYAESGSWLAEDLPRLREKLEAEVKRVKTLQEEADRAYEEKNLMGRVGYPTYEEEQEEKKREERVNFSVRVFPLLEMMRSAEEKKVPVMWGVP